MTEDRDHLRALIEAVLYLAPEPVPLKQLARATGQPPELIQTLLDSLMAEYDRSDHGVRPRMLAGGYAIGTKPELGAELKQVIAGLRPPKPLSKQAVETAAVVAMLQPVTAHEIQAARKVRNTDAIHTLLRRKLIAPAGRAQGRGKALQYRTTPQFLVEFGLKDLSELPTVEAFQQVPGIKTSTDPNDR
jgi:segregation and condensation protein B